MSFRTRLSLGFAAVVLVAFLQGGVSYLMFRQVGAEVTNLNENALTAARHATAAERLTFEAINNQKDFFATRAEEKLTSVRECLKALRPELDSLAAVAARTGDTESATKVADASKGLAGFGEGFDRGVESVGRGRAQEQQMDAKGAICDQEVEALVVSKKAEYLDAKDALAISNNINATVLAMRLSEKAYMLDHGSQHITAIERSVETILQGADELAKRRPSDTEKQQIKIIRGEIESYLKAAKAWVDQQKADAESAQLADMAKAMNRAGDAVS